MFPDHPIVWSNPAMYDLNEIFSGEVRLDELVLGRHFDALTQDFCSDFDIYEAEKSNLDFPGDPLRVNPSKIGFKGDSFDAEVLLQNLEEDVPSLGPDFDSVVEVNMTETVELIESRDSLHSKSEIVASVDAEDEGTGAEKMENTGCFGRRVELETSSIPSFRTVPAISKV